MIVKACEQCKALNTERKILQVLEIRAAKSRELVPQPTDPLVGVRILSLDAVNDLTYSGQIIRELCGDCATRAVTSAMNELAGNAATA